MSKLYCPGCDTAIDGALAVGARQMHCPECGIRFAVPEPPSDAARWGEVTTSKLAVVALLAGIGSLVLPFCLCPFLLFGVAATGPAGGPGAVGVGVAPAPVVVPAQPVIEETVVKEADAEPGAEDDAGDDE